MHSIINIAIFAFIVHVPPVYLSEMENRIEDLDRTAANHTSDMIYETRGDLITEQCKLQVMNESKNRFTHDVLKYRYNFVHLKLIFLDFSVNETKKVITKNDWIWTYKGENGARRYLNLPGDFGYLSFGLLWAHTLREKFLVDIKKTGNCSNLTIGLEETDLLIGKALGNMTSQIALQHDIYNSSYWCYNTRSWINSMFLYIGCKVAICTVQTIEYSCCKFVIDFTDKTRTVKCDLKGYKFGPLWWILPILIGEICFAFYPLLLTKLGMNFKTIYENMETERARTFSSIDLHNETTQFAKKDKNKKNRIMFISLKDSNNFTFLSTLCSPLHAFDLSGPMISRVLRLWIIILPLTLSTIHVVVDYIYAKDFMEDAVKKGALVGFSSVIAGLSTARKEFLYIFGGPIVAIAIYLSFGFLLVVFPTDLEEFVETGLPTHVRKFIFLTRMPLKLKERLSGIRVMNYKGYRKLHKLFLAQIFMLLHKQFWGNAFKMFYLRWKAVVFSAIAHKLQSVFAAVVLCFVCLPLYIIFCLLELLIGVLYYAYPVISCFFVVLKSFFIHFTAFFQNKGCVMKCLQYVLFLPMLILFCISWYMYCVLFFDGFWFLSKIVMFTYSGIIAYPKLSYGYLVLVFMAFYYLTESSNAFGNKYRDLLKLSLEACEKFQRKHADDSDTGLEEIKDIRTNHGIKSDLFIIIVDQHLPRRNQVLITIMKVTSVVTVLTISVELLITFDKFQELSLVSHVFTVLFICALPKIIKMMCLQNNRYQARRKLKQKLFRTIADYVKNINICSSDEDELREILLSTTSDYETFRSMDFDQ